MLKIENDKHDQNLKIFINNIVISCVFLLIFSSNLSYAQEGKSKKEFTEYVKNLKSLEVKNFVSIISGCWGCEVMQSDSSRAISNAVNITLIYQVEDACKMAIFDDFSDYVEFNISDCSIFILIENNVAVLNQKEVYYTKRKANKFLKPTSPHHSYNQIDIDTEKYDYSAYLVRDTKNGDSPELRKLEWYKLSEFIMEKIETIKESVKY
ncbi:hypothetical protein [Flavobacterium ardleyense]|uniref:hypothetical protein n=1 Tax=Flavobacterium ardleyense TaxID=2038737 RepID=UPI00298D304D|nr:hypothetical protein [Flavobacterium ardleyense]